MNLDSSNLPPGVKAAMRRKAVQITPENYAEKVQANHDAHNESALLTAERMLLEPPPFASFFVAGHPEPQGSKKAYVPVHPVTKEPYRDRNGRIIVNVIDDNPEGKKWKKLIEYTARMVYHEAPRTGPLVWRFDFVVKRPQGHFGTGRNEGKVKDSAPHFPTTRPDTLKLCRAVEDALTGVIWADDAQIVDQSAGKRYGSVEGVNITIREATMIATGSPTYEQLKFQPQDEKLEPELPLPLPGAE